MNFFEELKRRNVFKVGIVYAVTTWILLQLTDVVSEILELPVWAPKLILLILLIGFVPALILAWAFELTPEGLKLEKDVKRDESVTPRTGRKLDTAIIILLGLALGYFIWESRFETETERNLEAEAARATQEAAAPEFADIEPVRIDDSGEPASRNTIAVLPFTNRSADQADAYFTDGVHDDLLTQLSKIDAFSVISRTSVMEYRDTTKNLKDIARELSVANIMEGAVQRAGNRVRINVQLIDAESDEHLWAEIYDRELTTENLFDIQSEIAQNIAQALRATLTDSEKTALAKPPTDNLEAYDLYLQARQFALGETKIGYQTALELYREAIELDPEFTLAWIGLGQAHITNYWNYGGDPADRDKARQAIDRAKELDPTVPELYGAEGFYWYWGHLDYERALYNLEKAIELMPRNEEVHMWHGWASRRAGKWEQALQSMKTALELNPRIHFHWVEYAFTNIYLQRFDEANRALQKVRELDINHFWTKALQARIALATGDIGAAVRASTGAQHGDEAGFFITYLNSRILARRFEEAIQTAQDMPAEFEVLRQAIFPREAWTAHIHQLNGDEQLAVEAARAAMFRINGMREELGEDYRILQAEVRLAPILGKSGEDLLAQIEQARTAEPMDAVTLFGREYERAQALAMAGMVAEATQVLDEVLSGPNDTPPVYVDADPAFDGIRDQTEFIEMLGRHR